MQIVEFLGYLQDYGVTITIVALVLFFAFGFGQVGLKYLQQYLQPKLASNPRSHAFFSTAERLQNYHVPQMNISPDPARNLLFRDMLIKKIRVWEASMTDFVARDFSQLKTFEIKELFARTMQRSVLGYQADWKQAGVPDMVVTKFDTWNAPRLEAISISATSVFDGKSFTTPVEMTNAILTLMHALLIQTVIDAERTLGDLNGDLEGVIYRDLTIA